MWKFWLKRTKFKGKLFCDDCRYYSPRCFETCLKRTEPRKRPWGISYTYPTMNIDNKDNNCKYFKNAWFSW